MPLVDIAIPVLATIVKVLPGAVLDIHVDVPLVDVEIPVEPMIMKVLPPTYPDISVVESSRG